MRLFDALLDLLFPPKCIFCRRLLKPMQSDLCPHCRTHLPMVDHNIKRGMFYSECFSVYYYEDFVSDSVRRFKFEGMQQYAEVYARQIAMLLLKKQVSFDVLSWVPISDKRRRKRGYDQTLLIAQAIGQELKVPCKRTLRKVRHNKPQSRLTKASERHENVLGVYKAVDPSSYAGLRVLLIDDVITTGATLSECSRVLRTAGAASVVCATLAATRESSNK